MTDNPAPSIESQPAMSGSETAAADWRAAIGEPGLRRLRFAPESVVREATGKLAQAAEAAGSEERRMLREEVRIQAEAMLQERHDDPAAYVMRLPGVTEAFAAAKRDAALLGDAVRTRLAAQAALGLPAEAQRALTRIESTEILDGLEGLAPAARVAALAELGRRYGDQGPGVVAALAEAGLSPLETLLLDPIAGLPGRRALRRLAGHDTSGGQARPPEGARIAETVDRLITEGGRGLPTGPGTAGSGRPT